MHTGWPRLLAEGTVATLEAIIVLRKSKSTRVERDTAKWRTLSECDATLIEGNARMASILLRMKELQLEALRAEYTVRLSMSDIQRLRGQAKRIEQELEEAEQHAINIQAAKNDPNVRIYRNDAYINSDLTFEDAMREAFRATKVFEYYTSQSYADQEKLFLVRMVKFGEYNLQNYLIELENAFYTFEDSYGTPDVRLAILSLRDDIFGIPRTGTDGKALSEATRIAAMREKLTDASLLSAEGYLTIPFSTDFRRLSPSTRNHKLLRIEVEIIGSDIGNRLGRVLLRQLGTSVVKSLSGEKRYYRFPRIGTAVDCYFNGNRTAVDADVYPSIRMQDRPYVNTAWQLVLNQRDELENMDINLHSLTDIRIYLYYTDFMDF